MRGIAAGKTIYARLPAWFCAILLGAIFALTILPAWPHPPLYIRGEQYWGARYNEPKITDSKLYKAIADDVKRGVNYYAAAAAEQRVRYYPTSPPQVFREPTLAWFLAASRVPVVQVAVLFGLFGLLIFAFHRELVADGTSFWTRTAAIAVAVTGPSVVGVPDAIYWHEIWSALLIALSLLSYRKVPLGLTVVLGLLACLIREIAVPYLLVMISFALWQHRWKESAIWLGTIALFSVAFALHIAHASHLYRPGDRISQGWLGLKGWDFSIATAKWNIFLHLLPNPAVALAICLGILGLAGSGDERAHRAALIVFGYVSAFLIVGRPENYYWGILYAPLLSAGLVFAPAALLDLLNRAFFGSYRFRANVEKSI